MGRLLLTLLLLCASTAAGSTWAQIQKLPDYKAARIALSDSLPTIAVPKLQSLLARKDLDQAAQLNLRALLGEALVRSNQPALALKTLTGSGPKSLTWRAHAHAQLGELEKAADLLKKLKTSSASYQRALIFATLGEKEKALTLLNPYQKGSPAEQALAISILLDLGKIEEAAPLLKAAQKKPSKQDHIFRYLSARLQLLKKDRASAIGSFQALAAANNEELRLPSAYLHASHLGLADSLALDANLKEANASLISTLEQFPDSPRINEIFGRLEAWRSQLDTEKIEPWILSQPAPPIADTLYPNSIEQKTSPITALKNHQPAPLSLRSAHALYLLSLLHLDADEPKKARALLARLRLSAPPEAAVLVERSLIQTGLSHFASKQFSSALHTFGLIEDEASTSQLRATAKALKGTAAFALQDPKQAQKAFNEAKTLAQSSHQRALSQATTFNSAVAALQAGRTPQLKDLPPLSADTLKLERGLILADQRSKKSIPLLESFLKNHPDSPRYQEAALALAENYDPAVEAHAQRAKDLLAPLVFNDDTQAHLAARRVIALLALGDGFDIAQQFIAKNLKHPRAPELLFKQGQALMKKESGEAILSFERLLERFPKHPLAETARFLSARASFSVNTESDITRAIERYQQIIKADGPLATAAAIDLARLHIDRSEQEAALAGIENLLKKKNLSPHDRRSLLVLGAEAASQNERYEEALTFYDKLLAQKDLPVAWFNRTSFLRGRVLENLGRQNDALKAYYQVVLNNLEPTKMGEIEWQWHDKCALLGALPLLERNNEWQAALNLVLRVAQSGGPSSIQATERARKIRIEQMIFEEKE